MSTRTRASGEFEIAFEPLRADDPVIGRMRVTRTYTGGFEGTGIAQLLSVGTPVEGSAAHVAFEVVEGVLDGRRGGFLLQHHGLMWRGESRAAIAVGPDSGTDELLGLRGTLTLENLGSRHTYAFDYTFEAV